MKKKHLIFVLLAVFVLAGCGQNSSVEQESDKQESKSSEEMMIERDDIGAREGEMEEAPAIETEVKDLEEYDSSDELLEDVDSAMDDLDNI